MTMNFPRPRAPEHDSTRRQSHNHAGPLDGETGQDLDPALDEALERFLQDEFARAEAMPPREELRRLHDVDEQCRQAWGEPLDATAEIAGIAAAARVRFVQGGQVSRPLEPELVLAVVHAAQHGYRLCAVERGLIGRCWLPAGHSGQCLPRGVVWRWWRFLYGDVLPAGVTPVLVCRACTPKSWEPAPASCPHGRLT
jgi:hypothetical protein